MAVVKAQIHAGGRGKGTINTNPQQHGVQLVNSRPTKPAEVAGRLLGQTLVTIQTGPDGQTVRQVLVEEGCEIARELYLGIVVDRAAGRPVLMVSSEGGMDIEQVAAHTPELIFREPFDARCRPAELPGPQAGGQAGAERRERSARPTTFMKGLCRVFVAARLQPGGDQSAGGHQGAANCWRSTPR